MLDLGRDRINDATFVKRLRKERLAREEAERMAREEAERKEQGRLKHLRLMRDMGYRDTRGHINDLGLEEIENIEKTFSLLSNEENGHYNANVLNCIPQYVRNQMVTRIEENQSEFSSDGDDAAYLEGWIEGFNSVWNRLKSQVYENVEV